jgi:hypothetical protein
MPLPYHASARCQQQPGTIKRAIARFAGIDSGDIPQFVRAKPCDTHYPLLLYAADGLGSRQLARSPARFRAQGPLKAKQFDKARTGDCHDGRPVEKGRSPRI